MNDKYKDFLKTLARKVKLVDKMLEITRKHFNNEFVGMRLHAFDDSGWFGRMVPIKVTDDWKNVTTTYCHERNANILTPSYYWELATDFWNDLKEWNISFYNTDIKDGKHRPLVINYLTHETMGNYSFIWTKKEFDRLAETSNLFPIALRQHELPKGYYSPKETRLLGDEIENMTDDSIMVITADGWDQSDMFDIKYFNIYEINADTDIEETAQEIIGALLDTDGARRFVDRY